MKKAEKEVMINKMISRVNEMKTIERSLTANPYRYARNYYRLCALESKMIRKWTSICLEKEGVK